MGTANSVVLVSLSCVWEGDRPPWCFRFRKIHAGAYLAAACTNRKCFGGMEELEPGNVLYLTADDALSDLLYPRLTEAGADLDRVYAIHDLISILGDNSIEQLLDTHKIRLLIIDHPGISGI